MNNILKNISDIQGALTKKLMKVSITEQAAAWQSGMGIVTGEYAWITICKQYRIN